VILSQVNHTRFGRLEQGLLELLGEAARPLLEGSTPEALVVGVWSPMVAGELGNPCSAVADALELENIPAWSVETASATGAAAFHSGWRAVASGEAKRVLVVAGEKLTHLPTPRATSLLASVLTAKERAASESMVSMAARLTTEALARGRFTSKALKAVALKNHGQGALNPRAHFQKGLTDDEYLNSRTIMEPIRLYDCAPISDGAAAVMMERGAGRGEPEVTVAGVGQALDRWAVADRVEPMDFAATRGACRQAYAMAGWGPGKVDVVEMHDAFTPFELLGLEACGLFKPGRAGNATLDGVTAQEGELPVNPSGGLKARGHPIGATGLAQLCELFWQLTGAAGERQVPGTPRRALAHSIGGLAANNLVTLLELA